MSLVRKYSFIGARSDSKDAIFDELTNLVRPLKVFDNCIFSRVEMLENLTHRIKLNTKRTSRNFADYLLYREQGSFRRCQRFTSYSVLKNLITRQSLREQEVKLGRKNKVFCSTWLNNDKIIFGTKCNKIILLDVNTLEMDTIPSLNSSPERYIVPPEDLSGNHTMEINPSRTVLMTGGDNPLDAAFYVLPSLEPLCVGEGAHDDYIFDAKWLDDEHCVTGARDGTIALWRVPHVVPNMSDTPLAIKPLIVGKYTGCSESAPQRLAPPHLRAGIDQVRAIQFNDKRRELALISLNARIHQWDLETFSWKAEALLPTPQENVCMTQHDAANMYVVGSKSCISFLDRRDLSISSKVPTKLMHCSVRSLSFQGDLLTIGTGIGQVLFYDIRARSYLEDIPIPGEISTRYSRLKVRRGWVHVDNNFHEFHWNEEYDPAIYTHCYDASGVRLFTAGGPLTSSLCGNYAAIWK